MIVWGGIGGDGSALGSGSAYDPLAPFFIQQPPEFTEFSQSTENQCTPDIFVSYVLPVAATDAAARYLWQRLIGTVWMDIADGNTQTGNPPGNLATFENTDSATLIINYPGCKDEGYYRAVARTTLCTAGTVSNPAVFVSRKVNGVKCCVDY